MLTLEALVSLSFYGEYLILTPFLVPNVRDGFTTPQFREKLKLSYTCLPVATGVILNPM